MPDGVACVLRKLYVSKASPLTSSGRESQQMLASVGLSKNPLNLLEQKGVKDETISETLCKEN